MSRFNAKIKDLQSQLQQQLALAAQLETDNAALKDREQTLLMSVVMLHGSASALAACPSFAQRHRPGCSQAAGIKSGSAAAAASAQHSTHAAAHATASVSTAAASASSSGGGGMLAETARADKTDECSAIQKHIEEIERLIHAARQEMGPLRQHGAQQAYESLRTTSALRRLAAAPHLAVSYLQWDGPTRLEWMKSAVMRMAMLLPKYDFLESCRQEVHKIVDDIVMSGLVYAWLDESPEMMFNLLHLNMESGQHEPCPDYWHQLLVESANLKPQQKAALHSIWKHIGVSRNALLQQHGTMMQQLQQLQQQHQTQLQQFAREVQQLPIMQLAQARRWRQQHQAAPEQHQQLAGEQPKQDALHEQQQGVLHQVHSDEVCVDSRVAGACPKDPSLSCGSRLADTQGSGTSSTLTQHATPLPVAAAATAAACSGRDHSNVLLLPSRQAAFVVRPETPQPSQQPQQQSQPPRQPSQQQPQQQQPQQPPPQQQPEQPPQQPPQQQPQQWVVGSGGGCRFPHGPIITPPLEQEPAAELLLPVAGSAQAQLEADLTGLRRQLMLQEKLLYVGVYNIMDDKQLAAGFVIAWPFLPSAIALCEALQELGW